jgi:CRISPR/Cas system-associated exonuclease Cas4 (RecB family)
MPVQRIDAITGRAESPFKVLLDEQSLQFDVRRREERGEKPRTLYASDYGQCMLKVWRQFFPQDFPGAAYDPRTIRVFHNGEVVHERLQGYLEKSGIVFLAEVDVPRDALDVHGRCDGIAMMHDIFHVLEFKSINTAVVDAPKDEHIGQLMWYMEMWEGLRREIRDEFRIAPDTVVLQEDARALVSDTGRTFAELTMPEKMLLVSIGEVRGEIIYESKMNQGIYTFPVSLDPGMVRKVRGWFTEVARCVQERTPPVVRYARTKYPCSFGSGKCPYYGVCYPAPPRL